MTVSEEEREAWVINVGAADGVLLCCRYVCFWPDLGGRLKGVGCTKAFLAHFVKTYITATQNIRNGNTTGWADVAEEAGAGEQLREEFPEAKPCCPCVIQ